MQHNVVTNLSMKRIQEEMELNVPRNGRNSKTEFRETLFFVAYSRLKNILGELWSCVKVKVDVLGSQFLIARTVSVDM